jgi:hypothetical protein
MKEFYSLLENLQRNGCKVTVRNGHKTKVIIYGPQRGQMYIAHPGLPAIKPITSWARNQCQIGI